MRSYAQNLKLQYHSQESRLKPLSKKLSEVADLALDYGLYFVKPDLVSIAFALGVAAVGVGVYYGYRWYKRRQVPAGYISREVVPLQIGTGKPFALPKQSITSLPQLLSDSVRHAPQNIISSSFGTFSFWVVLLFIFAFNLLLLFVFTLQKPPSSRSKVKRKSSSFQKKQSSKKNKFKPIKRVKSSSFKNKWKQHKMIVIQKKN